MDEPNYSRRFQRRAGRSIENLQGPRWGDELFEGPRVVASGIKNQVTGMANRTFAVWRIGLNGRNFLNAPARPVPD